MKLPLNYLKYYFYFKAIDRRDKLCTEIYANIVNFITKKINLELSIENKISNLRRGQHQKFGKKYFI